jgi:3-hydroxy-3-methylglutaryl CoA synthase
MAGIISYGAYVPIYRLSREILSQQWGTPKGRGEKAIANADEDSITMAVEAAIDCMNGIDRSSIDGLYLASASLPYREKQCASIVAAAADLRKDILTIDLANSLRSGTSALSLALDSVTAGSAKKVLVVASDCRVPPPNSPFEPLFGDGAAAFIIGDADIAVSIEGRYTVSSDFIDIWKKDKGDTYIRAWEDRFIFDEGYMPILKGAVTDFMKKNNLSPKDITKAVFYALDARGHTRMANALGFDVKTQVQEPMFGVLGNTGTAFAMMQLVAALEEAKPGDRILLANYGDGADVYLLKVEEGIEKIRERRGIKKHLASKMMLSNYGKYLRYRDLMEWEQVPVSTRTHQESSLNVIYREEAALTRGHGHRCKVCGHVQFPPQRVCMWCQAKDQLEEVRISDKKGELFTFSLDDRATFALDLPNVFSVVNLEGGGRVYGQMTDRDPSQVKVGMPIELTFRKFHEGSGFHNYSWKCRPVRA